MTGATGFVGRALFLELFKAGNELVVLSRDPARARAELGLPCKIYPWDALTEATRPAMFEGVEAVVHLVGDSIGEGRWTEEKKKRIFDSRIRGTQNLWKGIHLMEGRRPATVVCAAAVGIHGPKDSFLTRVCRDWEETVFKMALPDIRVAALRLGVVLGRGGGIIEQILPMFRAGLGGRIGSGTQVLSWIGLSDAVGLFCEALVNPAYRGAFNAVAPVPAANAEFTRQLARAVDRPAVIPVPEFAIKAALGEAACLPLDSIEALPDGPVKDFRFRTPDLDTALRALDLQDEVLEAMQWVPAPRAAVFPFFSHAENLGQLTPEWLHFRILASSTPQIQAGTTIDYSLKIKGFPVKWRTRIETFEAPTRFIDTQEKGPYAKWHHTHEFFEVRGGTLVTDRVLYRLPLGVLGDWVAGGMVAHDVTQIFAYRRKQISVRWPG